MQLCIIIIRLHGILVSGPHPHQFLDWLLLVLRMRSSCNFRGPGVSNRRCAGCFRLHEIGKGMPIKPQRLCGLNRFECLMQCLLWLKLHNGKTIPPASNFALL